MPWLLVRCAELLIYIWSLEMIKRKNVLLFVIICMLLPSVHALNLVGNRLSPITFEPGKVIVNHYSIEETNKKVEVTLGGEMSKYARVTEVVDNKFDLIIEVPEILPEPGSYRFSLHAKEVGSTDGSGIGSLVSISLIFLVEVPPRGKEIGLSFIIPDVNEHEPVPVSVNIESKGLEKIDSLKGSVTFYNEKNDSMAHLALKEQSLTPLSSTSLSAALPADTLSTGKYWAEAVISYDGREKKAYDNFKIGYLDLLLINYSSYLEQEFGEFWAIVENNWGNTIQSAYAVVSINGQELLTTPTVVLGPWKQEELKGILRTDFAPGNYSGKIQLFYESLSKEQNVTFIIYEPLVEESTSSISIVIAGVIFILITVILMFFLLWKKKSAGRRS